MKNYRWCAHKGDKTFYATSSAGKKHVRMHILITGKKDIDHEDHNGLNNRRENLRAASDAENNRNRNLMASNTTGFNGVFIDRNRFRAAIRVNHKRHYLGSFDAAVEAARAYDEAAVKYHGEFAALNDVGDYDLILNQKTSEQS